MLWNFGKLRQTVIWKILMEMHNSKWKVFSYLWSLKSSRRKMLVIPLFLVGLIVIYHSAFRSNSYALYSLFGLTTFNVLIIVGDILNQIYQSMLFKQWNNFGLSETRFEVLIHFSILFFSIFFNIWIVCLGFDLLFNKFNQEIILNSFILSSAIGLLIHFFLSFNNNPLLRVFKVSGAQTLLQKKLNAVTNFSRMSCVMFQSPLAILGIYIFVILIGLNLISYSQGRWIDFIGGSLISFGTIDSAIPLFIYTGKILLQVVPSNISGQLEQVLREALTIDGVLEFRNEMFFTISYGKMAGMLHVRIRRDANEQVVLASVYEKVHVIVPQITIQITKDDFLHRLPHHCDLDSSVPVVVTVNRDPDLSPIPLGPNNHIIYSSTSSSSTCDFNRKFQHPNSAHPHLLTNDDSLELSNSSIFVHDTPKLLESSQAIQAYRSNPLFRPTHQANHLFKSNFNPLDEKESFCLVTQ